MVATKESANPPRKKKHGKSTVERSVTRSSSDAIATPSGMMLWATSYGLGVNWH